MFQVNDSSKTDSTRRKEGNQSLETESQISQVSLTERNHSFSGNAKRRPFYLRIHMTGGSRNQTSLGVSQNNPQITSKEQTENPKSGGDTDKTSSSGQLLKHYTSSSRFKSKLIQRMSQQKSFPPLFIGCIKSHYGPRWAYATSLRSTRTQSRETKSSRSDQTINTPKQNKVPDTESEIGEDEEDEIRIYTSDSEHTGRQKQKIKSKKGQNQSSFGILKNRKSLSSKAKNVSFDEFLHPDLISPPVEYGFPLRIDSI